MLMDACSLISAQGEMDKEEERRKETFKRFTNYDSTFAFVSRWENVNLSVVIHREHITFFFIHLASLQMKVFYVGLKIAVDSKTFQNQLCFS